jgi:hypothetical protein
MRDLFADVRLRAVARLLADVRLEAGTRLFADVRFFAGVRLVAVRFVAVRLAAGRFFAFFVEFVEFLRGVLFARVLRFLAVFLRGAAFARVVRFFAVALRGPVFLAVALLVRVLLDRFFVPPAFAPVARFLAGAFRVPAFLAVVLRGRDFRRFDARAAAYAAQGSSSYVRGGVPAYCGCGSSAPRARRPARHAAMMTAPNPYVAKKNPMTNPRPGTSAPKRRIPNPAKNAPSRPPVPLPWTMSRPKIRAPAT